jgi:hypothetical protein
MLRKLLTSSSGYRIGFGRGNAEFEHIRMAFEGHHHHHGGLRLTRAVSTAARIELYQEVMQYAEQNSRQGEVVQ